MSKRRMLILGALVLLFVVLEVLLPKPLNWTPSYSHLDKNPFGAYVLAQLLPGFLSEADPRIEPITLYETSELEEQLNLLVLTDEFYPSEEDVQVLLSRVADGDHAFIAAHLWNSYLQDSLGFSADYTFQLPAGAGGKADSVDLRFTQPDLPGQYFRVPAGTLPAAFDSLPASATVLAKAKNGKIILAAIPWGKGMFYLSSTPLLFTNLFLMQENSRPYAEAALSYLPEQELLWTEYYHLGRMESPTPLRFILREPALRWSYYLGMGILLSFVLFSMKRRQRAIPVVEPPANTSLQFAETVARLYYGQRDHLDLARKKISYFYEWLREQYQMPAGAVDELYLQRLIRKSGKPEAEVRSLFAYIQQIEQRRALAPEDLLLLQHKLESFIQR